MTITSVAFLIFLCTVFAVFYCCPVKHRWIVLLAGSIVFYILAGAVKFLPMILFTTLVIWLSGRTIGKLYEELDQKLEDKELDRKAKKKLKEEYKAKAFRYVLLALVLTVGFLCVTKFTKYAVSWMNAIVVRMGGGARFSAAWVIVPLGISYFTFSTVGYLLDVYWRRYSYEKNFFRFFLYAIYFPHIVQGPISRYNKLGWELKKEELRFDAQRVAYGLELMLWGFFKKLVIADRLNIFVTAVYNQKAHTGSVFLMAMVFDAIQIYTDFSGYTDIVRGASQVFDVELEQNFNHPFFSQTVPEFWRRWHMSLGSWFKDYVYYPCTISGMMKNLNKKLKGKVSERKIRFVLVVIPVFITWVLTGLWHGTGKTYLAWGIYYSILITISTAFHPEFEWLNQKLKINTEAYSWKLFRMIRTFCFFMGGRLLTSPGGLYWTKQVIKHIIFDFGPWNFVNGKLFQFGLSRPDFYVLTVALLVLWGGDCMQERFSVRERLSEQNMVFRWGIIYLAIFGILIFGVYGLGYDATAFLYTQY